MDQTQTLEFRLPEVCELRRGDFRGIGTFRGWKDYVARTREFTEITLPEQTEYDKRLITAVTDRDTVLMFYNLAPYFAAAATVIGVVSHFYK